MDSFLAGAGSLWNEPLVRAGVVFVALRCAKLDSREAAACATVVAATGALGKGLSDVGLGTAGHGRALGKGLSDVGLGTAGHGRAVGKGLKSIASSLSGVGDGVHGRGSAAGVKVSTHANKKNYLARRMGVNFNSEAGLVSLASSQRHPDGDIFRCALDWGQDRFPPQSRRSEAHRKCPFDEWAALGRARSAVSGFFCSSLIPSCHRNEERSP